MRNDSIIKDKNQYPDYTVIYNYRGVEVVTDVTYCPWCDENGIDYGLVEGSSYVAPEGVLDNVGIPD